MAERIGTVAFDGIDPDNIKGGYFTLSRGISPSYGAIIFDVPTEVRKQIGTLRFEFENRRIEFRNAAIEDGSLTFAGNGREASVKIVDRRWKWRYGFIDGRFNSRLGNGELDPTWKKSARELATMLLKAMGENGVDVSAFPAANPEVYWVAANPAQELAALCDEFNCTIILGLDDRVRIKKINQGRALPETGGELHVGFGFTAKLKPKEILFVGGDIRVQSALKLEAVGLDLDGQIKPIGDLSYKPADGWESQLYYEFADVDDEPSKKHRDPSGRPLIARDLALQSVYRWYRVKEQAHGGLAPPKWTAKINSIKDLLPISGELLDEEVWPDGSKRPKKAMVHGIFDAGGEIPENFDEDQTLYQGSFVIDEGLGLVQFGNPVVQVDEDSGEYRAAELYLTCTYAITDTNDGTKFNFRQPRNVPGGLNTGPYVIRRPDVERTVKVVYNGLNKVANTIITTPTKEADHYIDAALAQFDADSSNELAYEGLLKIEPDGAIAQVSWSVGGGQIATTRASRGVESADRTVPSFDERRRREDAAKEAAKAAEKQVKAARDAVGGAKGKGL